MKQEKKLSILAASAVAMSLLLGASATQAVVVTDGPVATGITNLDVSGGLFNVDFVIGTWPDIYGATPSFDFSDTTSAGAAVAAVNDALNGAGVPLVGESSTEGLPLFQIGYEQNCVAQHLCP